MFGWMKKTEAGPVDPKTLVTTFASARNGQCEKALKQFQTLDVHARALVIQEAAYLPVTEGVAKLVGYALSQDPDGYVRSVAHRVSSARVPLRMQALQYSAA